MCAYCASAKPGEGRRGGKKEGQGRFQRALCQDSAPLHRLGGGAAGTEQFGNLPEITQPVAEKLAANLWRAAGGWAKEEVPRPAAGR